MAGFWSTNNIEPKRNYRFMVQFTGIGIGGADVLYWAKTTGIPNYTVTSVTHDFLDNKYNFPGRIEWQDINMTLVDPISPNAVGQLNKIIIDSGYRIPGVSPGMPNASGADAKLFTISKIKEGRATAGHSSTAVDGGALGDIVISIMDSNGKEVEKWTLKNPLIMSAKFGDLDYANDELKTVELSLKYDWAECDTKDTSASPGPDGVGSFFGTTS